jgi:hypothetical protein
MVLYVQQDSLYEMLTHKLQERGFHFHQYDCCVANMIVNGKQLAVIVDNLKVSKKDVEVLSNFLEN